jgi:hypothetical protein
MTAMRNLALGAAAFASAHVVEVARWREWFDAGGRFGPWFLNTGASVALTLGVLALTAAVTTAASARTVSDAAVQSLTIACGAAGAMAVTLFVLGPGTIFPIVLALGAGLCVLSSAGGGFLGFAAAAPWRRHRKDDLPS